jgi:hypothetical protein
MTSPMYRRISLALAMGAPVHGLNPYPNVYRTLSERMPGYRCMSQVPPKLSRPSSTTKVRAGRLGPAHEADLLWCANLRDAGWIHAGE